jgi:hypothetical protein
LGGEPGIDFVKVYFGGSFFGQILV